MVAPIPFHRPLVLGDEMSAVESAFVAGELGGNGSFTHRCERWLEGYAGTDRALLTPSCTSALEMAALLIEVGVGDEVIMPSWTFVSTANAFVLRGATPVFIDVNPLTGCIEPEAIAAAITPKTKAIVPVHYGGGGCDMPAIMALAEERGLWVIEDAAQSIGSAWQGAAYGSMGHLGALSFHATKNITSGGEGGALLVNDGRLFERAEKIREKGTNRAAFLKGERTHYEWVDVGSSYLPSEIQAAALSVQLSQLEPVTERRKSLWQNYRSTLKPFAKRWGGEVVEHNAESDYNGHLFALLMRDERQRQSLVAALNTAGISAAGHYVPLHRSPGGERWGRTAGRLVHTERLGQCLLRLPLFYGLREEEQERVIDAVVQWSAKGTD